MEAEIPIVLDQAKSREFALAIIIRRVPFVSLGSACWNRNNRHSKFLSLDVLLRRNWHIDTKLLKYQVAFAQAW